MHPRLPNVEHSSSVPYKFPSLAWMSPEVGTQSVPLKVWRLVTTPAGCHLVDVPARRTRVTSHAIEIPVAGLDRRVRGILVPARARKVIHVGNHSGRCDLVNAAELERATPVNAAPVEIPVGTQGQTSGAASPADGKAGYQALDAGGRNFEYSANAVGAAERRWRRTYFHHGPAPACLKSRKCQSQCSGSYKAPLESGPGRNNLPPLLTGVSIDEREHGSAELPDLVANTIQ